MPPPRRRLRLAIAAAALQFFDFFSTSMQKMALEIVTEIVPDCNEEDVTKAMEAAPVLCNILQSADKTIQELDLSCLGMLAYETQLLKARPSIWICFASRRWSTRP